VFNLAKACIGVRRRCFAHLNVEDSALTQVAKGRMTRWVRTLGEHGGHTSWGPLTHSRLHNYRTRNCEGQPKCKSGLTCLGDSSSYGQVAVYLDSSNNSIEDVSISDFDDGILVGSQATAQSNVLLNIVGNTNNSHLSPINVVHIWNSSTASVSDISITGVANQGLSAYTIQDDKTSPGVPIADSHVAMYVLGKSTADGYSRFTTSPNAATWVVSSNATPFAPCAPGSLYSNTSNGGGALYVCVYGTSGNSWKLVTTHSRARNVCPL